MGAKSKQRRIGAHIPVAGGLVKKGVAEAERIGAEVLQIFVGSPRTWASPRVDEEAAKQFRRECEERGWPVFVHASYLINLASPVPEAVERSAEHLRGALASAEKLGAEAVVVHVGSSVDGDRAAALKRLKRVFRSVVKGAPASVKLLVEPTAGGTNSMASSFESTAEYMRAVGIDEIGLCLDTCHLHAAGEPLADGKQLAASLRKLNAEIGAGRIGLVHFNDSRDPQGSHRDRHAKLGDGLLGEAGLRSVAETPLLAGLPLIIETETREHDVAYAKRIDRE